MSPSSAAILALCLVTLTACAPRNLPRQPATAGTTAPTAGPDAAARWWAHVAYLADDAMRGRETGSPEHRKAADYVADRFARAGLAPAGSDGYLQPVQLRSRTIDEARSSLALVTGGVS